MPTFTAPLTLHGKTATGLTVPETVIAELNLGKRPPVHVTLNGTYTYQSTVGVMGGQSLLPVSAEHRAAAGLQAGDPVTVTLTPDVAPREVTLPPALQAALDAQPAARAAFDQLPPSQRREHARAVETAKAEATRARRVQTILAALTLP
ncbi:YdeI/OmpD-associated family protein [Deinococcus radiotolerans]|uniref:DUF1905 domain-containing protein n=1 Tax=Deinococcus radiotolerans TaxID=1309407 RepID=A0ABQ2FGD3_9DEIO|nr:YdeI/OmpD-associated family protein [Deinococcus radiotolerans]GGK95852.1 hypothetical protein GCM10010844_12900 [Deinococcus radiotolerans]